MNVRNCIPALAVGGLGALVIAVAPMAAAAPGESGCASAGSGSTLCQTNGSAELHAFPGPVTPPGFGNSPFVMDDGLAFHRQGGPNGPGMGTTGGGAMGPLHKAGPGSPPNHHVAGTPGRKHR